jgi:hypothetical protein
MRFLVLSLILTAPAAGCGGNPLDGTWIASRNGEGYTATMTQLGPLSCPESTKSDVLSGTVSYKLDNGNDTLVIFDTQDSSRSTTLTREK